LIIRKFRSCGTRRGAVRVQVPDGAVLLLEPESTLVGRVLYTKYGSEPEIGQVLTYEKAYR